MTTASFLREEAIKMLEGKGAILDVARRVSRVLERSDISGAIVGGVSVVLHGHVRTTADVDVYVPDPLQPFADALQADGFELDRTRREFLYEGVPVHFVTARQAPVPPGRFEQIDDIRTVSLGDLINLKLHSGASSVLRAQDLADVIGLIRANGLTSAFARHLHKPLRAEFRRLIRAVATEQKP